MIYVRSIPAIKYMVERSNSKVLKSAVEKLSNQERQKLTEVLRKEAEKVAIDYANQAQSLRNELNDVKDKVRGFFKYKAFYDTLQGNHHTPLISGSVTIDAEMLSGIEEAVDYLKKKPDQVIQHYGDPDPKTKVYQHRKDTTNDPTR